MKEFIYRFGASRDVGVNLRGLNEELLEFEQALENLMKESCDVIYMMYCLAEAKPKQGEVDPETIEAIRRVMKISNEFFGTHRMTEAFARVHISNMSKLGADGQPIKNDWGKVVKGPNYEPPYLWDLIQ